MSIKRFVIFSLLIICVVIILSLVVWYLIKPEIQFFIYWVVGTIVAVMIVAAATVQISGYSLRDFQRIKNPIHERTRKALVSETNNSKRILEPKPRGIPFILQRDETEKIIEQLHLGNPVLLTGEAGTGKSGIAVALLLESENLNIFPLLIDARRLIAYSNAAEMRSHFDIEEPLIEGIERIGEDTGIWMVLDQLDNIAGSQGCNLIIDTLIECSKTIGVSVIVISRHNEANENGALRPLLENGFIEITCIQLPIEKVKAILREVGVLHPPYVMLDLATNLLNLDLICEIAKLSGPDAVNDLEKSTDLWARYIDTIRDRENNSGGNQGDRLFEEAINLAHLGLSNEDRTFRLNYTLTINQRRLISYGIIIRVPDFDLVYQFRHEKLQDYLYARHACNQQYFLPDVQEDIDSLHLRNILLWMSDLYQQMSPTLYKKILEELLDG